MTRDSGWTRGHCMLKEAWWVTPDPMHEEKTALLGSRTHVRSLILLEARPAAGETNQEIVTAAWDFRAINRRYENHAELLAARPTGRLRTETAACALRAWGRKERSTWQEAIRNDPLLPKALLPRDYLGEKTWRIRRKVLHQAGKQMRSFDPEASEGALSEETK